MRIFEQCVAIYMVLLLPQTQDVDCCRVPRSKPPFHALGRGILSPTVRVQEDFVFGAELIQSTRHDIRTATGAGTRSWPLDPHPVETRGWCHSGAGVCRPRDWLSRRGSQIQLGWHRFACRSLGGDVSAGIHADVDCHTRCFVRGEGKAVCSAWLGRQSLGRGLGQTGNAKRTLRWSCMGRQEAGASSKHRGDQDGGKPGHGKYTRHRPRAGCDAQEPQHPTQHDCSRSLHRPSPPHSFVNRSRSCTVRSSSHC